MSIDWRDVVHLLRGDEKTGSTVSELLTQITPKNQIFELFHILCCSPGQYISSKEWHVRRNTAQCLEVLTKFYQDDFSQQIRCGGASEEPILRLDDINISSFDIDKYEPLLSGEKVSIRCDQLTDNVYDKSWLIRQRKQLVKRLGIDSNDKDIVYALENDSTATIIESEDIEMTPCEYQDNEDGMSLDIPPTEYWFLRILRLMTVGILDPVWELRHGYCMSLSKIIISLPEKHLNELPTFFLEDILCSSILILMLDRFLDVDNETSTSISPVKEMASQLIAISLKILNSDYSDKILIIVSKLCDYKGEWCVIFGGLIALKYLLPTQHVNFPSLCKFLDITVCCLSDPIIDINIAAINILESATVVLLKSYQHLDSDNSLIIHKYISDIANCLQSKIRTIEISFSIIVKSVNSIQSISKNCVGIGTENLSATLFDILSYSFIDLHQTSENLLKSSLLSLFSMQLKFLSFFQSSVFISTKSMVTSNHPLKSSIINYILSIVIFMCSLKIDPTSTNGTENGREISCLQLINEFDEIVKMIGRTLGDICVHVFQDSEYKTLLVERLVLWNSSSLLSSKLQSLQKDLSWTNKSHFMFTNSMSIDECVSSVGLLFVGRMYYDIFSRNHDSLSYLKRSLIEYIDKLGTSLSNSVSTKREVSHSLKKPRFTIQSSLSSNISLKKPNQSLLYDINWCYLYLMLSILERNDEEYLQFLSSILTRVPKICFEHDKALKSFAECFVFSFIESVLEHGFDMPSQTQYLLIVTLSYYYTMADSFQRQNIIMKFILDSSEKSFRGIDVNFNQTALRVFYNIDKNCDSKAVEEVAKSFVFSFQSPIEIIKSSFIVFIGLVIDSLSDEFVSYLLQKNLLVIILDEYLLVNNDDHSSVLLRNIVYIINSITRLSDQDVKQQFLWLPYFERANILSFADDHLNAENTQNNPTQSKQSLVARLLFRTSEIISVEEVISNYDLWIHLSLHGQGHYDRNIRELSSSLFKYLVPLAPLFRDKKSCGNESSSTALIDFILLRKSPPSIQSSSLPLDQDILIALSTAWNSPSLSYQSDKNLSFNLREYQWAGISFLTHLRRCGLGGLLADDMGLGKTIQALVSLAIFTLEGRGCSLPHLVICPASLIQHWKFEISKFFNDSLLRPIIGYSNDYSPKVGDVVILSYNTLQRLFRSSSETIFSRIWGSVVLDEAHCIRNPNTSTAQSIFALKGKFRIALTGTPVQNNVQEIWSVMQFLIPDFLGSYEVFREKYVRPILRSVKKRLNMPTEAKSSVNALDSKYNGSNLFSYATLGVTAEGLSALNTLHRQVLPFILRRTKENVLKELPKKSIIHIFCPLSEIQKQLYSTFQNGLNICDQKLEEEIITLKSSLLANEMHSNAMSSWISRIPPLQALTYLQLLSVHPSLVIASKHKQYKQRLLNDRLSSGKMFHLAKLLLDSGVIRKSECVNFEEIASESIEGDSGESTYNSDSDNDNDCAKHSSSSQHTISGKKRKLDIRNQLNKSKKSSQESDPIIQSMDVEPVHKCLIFATHRKTLDIIESCVLKKSFPTVLYSRLDGSSNPSQRGLIALEFNETNNEQVKARDKQIRILLMTTRACGLGLNLSAADTVIFVEHDWNPFVDLQAMDRAHRLGQTKPVTVYRLLAESTVEARIVTLQDLKLFMASEVVNDCNAHQMGDSTETSYESHGSQLWNSLSFQNASNVSNTYSPNDSMEYENLDLDRFLSSIGDV